MAWDQELVMAAISETPHVRSTCKTPALKAVVLKHQLFDGGFATGAKGIIIRLMRIVYGLKKLQI